jgi:hypothetical protein
MIESYPNIVQVILPKMAGVLRPGAVRPAVVTSVVADQASNKINCTVFLEDGDVTGKVKGDTYWIANVEYMAGGQNTNENVPRWYGVGAVVS